MECEACGSRRVTRRSLEGFLLEECQLCGNLQGDDDAVARVEEIRRGRERGLDDHVAPLVEALESTGVLQVTHASGGSLQTRESPHVFFRATRNDGLPLERLLRTLEHANHETELVWTVELTLQHTLLYILRPRFWKRPQEVTAEEIALARRDLPLLAQRLRRDLQLSWWRD